MNKEDLTTDFLLKPQSFSSGMGSVLNIFAVGEKFNTSASSEEADSRAIKSDWAMVGEDIRNSMIEILVQK